MNSSPLQSRHLYGKMTFAEFDVQEDFLPLEGGRWARREESIECIYLLERFLLIYVLRYFIVMWRRK